MQTGILVGIGILCGSLALASCGYFVSKRASARGLALPEKASSMASSYQTFSTLDLNVETDPTRLSKILGTLQRDRQAYQASIKTIADVVSKIPPPVSNPRKSSVRHPHRLVPRVG